MILNMADGIIRPCNVACDSGIMTVNSPSGSTLCDVRRLAVSDFELGMNVIV